MKRLGITTFGTIAAAYAIGSDVALTQSLPGVSASPGGKPQPQYVVQGGHIVSLPSPFKDGMVVRGSDGAVYFITGGKRHLIPSEAAFHALGFRWENTIKLPDEALKSIPEAPPLAERLPAYPEGTLLKGEAPTVFVIRAGARRAVPDLATFTALGFKWENVRQVPESELAAIPEASPLASPADFAFKDGTLLKGSAPTVYVMSGGRRRAIPDIDTFQALGYRWENVLQIADWHLASIPELPPLPSYQPPERETTNR